MSLRARPLEAPDPEDRRDYSIQRQTCHALLEDRENRQRARLPQKTVILQGILLFFSKACEA